jgi:hypothetical protein
MTIDSLGRRPLQIFGCLFLCITFIINAAIIKIYPTDSNNTSAHWAFVVFTWLFNLGKRFNKLLEVGITTNNYRSLLHNERTVKLGYPGGALRNSNASEGCIVGSNDFLRLQHDDRTSDPYRDHVHRLGKQQQHPSESIAMLTCSLEILPGLRGLQLLQRYILLVLPAGDERPQSRRYERTVPRQPDFRTWQQVGAELTR